MCCRWGGGASGSLLQAEVFREVETRGTQRPCGAGWSQGESGLQPGRGSYLTVHDGLLLLQLDLLLSCLSTQQSLEDRPFRKAALLLQGYLTIWGQSTGKVVSAEEAVVRGPGCGGREENLVLVAGTGLSHAQPTKT